jgi:hypothetical protein
MWVRRWVRFGDLSSISGDRYASAGVLALMKFRGSHGETDEV